MSTAPPARKTEPSLPPRELPIWIGMPRLWAMAATRRISVLGVILLESMARRTAPLPTGR